MTSTATDLTVAAWPGCAPRLLRPVTGGSEDHADYVQAGGYRPLTDADALLEQVDLSGLLGRGGAAFPLGTKLRTVRDAGRRGIQTGRRRERRRGRTGIGQGPLAAAQPTAPGARRPAAGRRDGRSQPCVCVRVRRTVGRCGLRCAVRTRRRRPSARRTSRGDRRTRLRRGRGNRGRATYQRRTRQTHRQAAPAVRGGRVGTPDDGQQRRDAGQPALHPRTRLAELPRSRHADVTWDVPGHHHRRRATGGAVRDSPWRSVFRPAGVARADTGIGARSSDGWLFRGPGQHATSSTRRSTTRPSADSAAASGAVRSRSSPTTARSPSRRR